MVETVGHRGAAALEPENTLRGFRLAAELGCDWTECDVRLTRDDRLIIMHDETVDRTTDGTGAVADLSFDEVRALDAGKGETVPTLDEVLATIKGKLRLQLELKGPGTAAPAVDAVRRAGMERGVVFISFDLDRLMQVKRIDASLQVGALFADPPDDACAEAAALDARGIFVLYKNLTAELVAEARAAGLEIGCWNPDTEPEWRAMLALDLDILSSNRPDALLALLGRHNKGMDTN